MADNASSTTNVTQGAPAPEYPSAFQLFRPSWEGLKLNLTELIVIFLVPSAVLSILFIIASGLAQNGTHVASAIVIAIAAVLAVIYVALVGPAMVHIQLKSSRMEKATYESAWETSQKYWWRFILLSIVVGLTILIGFILLIVPGVIFLKRYFLSQYALIDQDLGLRDSMHKSNELTRGRAMAVFGIIGVDILINLPSVIPVIGQIVSFVLQIAYFCAPAIRYQQLKELPAVAET